MWLTLNLTTQDSQLRGEVNLRIKTSSKIKSALFSHFEKCRNVDFKSFEPRKLTGLNTRDHFRDTVEMKISLEREIVILSLYILYELTNFKFIIE